MDISKFKLGEMYNGSSGKTSASLVAAHMLIITGCVMGIKGAFDKQGDSMLQGLGFATLGAGLLGIRRFSNDKVVPESVQESSK